MQQIKLYDNSPNYWIYTSFFADVKDKITSSITYTGQVISSPHFLMEYQSQLTGKIKRFNPSIVFGYSGSTVVVNRYVYFLSKVSFTVAQYSAALSIHIGLTSTYFIILSSFL